MSMCSATVSTAVHGSAGGQLPSGGALVLVVLACAVIGAGTSCVSSDGARHHIMVLVAALSAGQFVGHVVLVFVGGHHHDERSFAPTMLAAHSAAVLACAVLISLAEYLYLVCASVLCWLMVFTANSIDVTTAVRFHAKTAVWQRILASLANGTRAPPAHRLCSA